MWTDLVAVSRLTLARADPEQREVTHSHLQNPGGFLEGIGGGGPGEWKEIQRGWAFQLREPLEQKWRIGHLGNEDTLATMCRRERPMGQTVGCLNVRPAISN